MFQKILCLSMLILTNPFEAKDTFQFNQQNCSSRVYKYREPKSYTQPFFCYMPCARKISANLLTQKVLIIYTGAGQVFLS